MSQCTPLAWGRARCKSAHRSARAGGTSCPSQKNHSRSWMWWCRQTSRFSPEEIKINCCDHANRHKSIRKKTQTTADISRRRQARKYWLAAWHSIGAGVLFALHSDTRAKNSVRLKNQQSAAQDTGAWWPSKVRTHSPDSAFHNFAAPSRDAVITRLPSLDGVAEYTAPP